MPTSSFRVDDDFVFTTVYPLRRSASSSELWSNFGSQWWRWWAAFGISTNSGRNVSREETVAVVEAYLRGLAGKDISKIPFAANITFEGPRVGKLIGRNAVVGFLTSILPVIKSVGLSGILSREILSQRSLRWRQSLAWIRSSIACMSAAVN
jgi:hypothetical protein